MNTEQATTSLKAMYEDDDMAVNFFMQTLSINEQIDPITTDHDLMRTVELYRNDVALRLKDPYQVLTKYGRQVYETYVSKDMKVLARDALNQVTSSERKEVMRAIFYALKESLQEDHWDATNPIIIQAADRILGRQRELHDNDEIFYAFVDGMHESACRELIRKLDEALR